MNEAARIAALPLWQGRPQIEPVTAGRTNRNFTVLDGNRRYFARIGAEIPQHGISRAIERRCATLAAQAGIAPEVIYAEDGIMITALVAGETLDIASAQDSKTMARIAGLRQRCPQVALSTDIIVGFPEESDDEFEQTLELLQLVEYDEIFSFMYSPRPQTVSAKLYDDDVDGGVKRARLKRVQTLQQEISLAKNRQRIGEMDEILVDGPSKLKNGQVMGRTRSNRIVNLAAPESLVGQIVSVRIASATANSLLGELLSAAAVGSIPN